MFVGETHHFRTPLYGVLAFLHSLTVGSPDTIDSSSTQHGRWRWQGSRLGSQVTIVMQEGSMGIYQWPTFMFRNILGRFLEFTYPPGNDHISHHLGKFGKSSSSKCHFFGGYVIVPWRVDQASGLQSVSLGCNQKSSQIWPSGSLRSSLPIVGEVTKKPGLVNAIVSCTYLHTRNSDMNRKDGGYVV